MSVPDDELQPPPSPRRSALLRSLIFWAGLIAVGECVALVYWPAPARSDQPIIRQRLTDRTTGAVGPGNGTADSDVTDWDHPLLPAYVGVDVCEQCHPGEAVRHRRSGHSRTFRITNLAQEFADLQDRSLLDPERCAVLALEPRQEQLIGTVRPLPKEDCPGGAVAAGHASPERPSAPQRKAAQFALGSGTHATTFLSLLDSVEPAALEFRASVFAPGHRLGLTPNHAGSPVTQPLEQLGRIRRGRELELCLGCHTTTVQVRGEQLADLRENVGCESCHGPGRRHVMSMRANRQALELDPGSPLPSARAEIEICGRCHRLPNMLTTPPTPDNPKLARFQPVGLLSSNCFLKSGERLRCSHCHEPHSPVEHDPVSYERVCRNCHAGQAIPAHEAAHRVTASECPQSPRTGCIACHMPPVEVFPGIAFHDHWIRVRRTAPQPVSAPPAQ